MRLIDADALMETIQDNEYELLTKHNSKGNGMFTIGIQQAVDEATTIEPGKWISVSERLPEVEQSVLCIDDEGTPHVAKNWVDWEDGSISFEVSDLNCWIKCAHWMPFPDPPRKDDEA